VLILELKPVTGIVKNCKVFCQPDELKEYGEGVKVVVISEKIFSKLMSSLADMEEDLLKLKELELDNTLRNIEDIRKKIELNLKELSYSEFMK
jgi:reverse gyrase